MAKGFIDLARKQEKCEAVPCDKIEGPSFPSFYLSGSGVEFPDEMIGKDIEATVKLHIRSKSENTRVTKEKGKKCEYSYDIDVKAIRLPEGKAKNAQQMIEEGLEDESNKKG